MQVSLSALQAERRQLDYTAVAFKCIIKEFNLLNKGSFFSFRKHWFDPAHSSLKDANEVKV